MLETIHDRVLFKISGAKKEVGSSNVCHLEFTGSDIEDIEKLLQIVGKHVYNGTVEKDGKSYNKLFIE